MWFPLERLKRVKNFSNRVIALHSGYRQRLREAGREINFIPQWDRKWIVSYIAVVAQVFGRACRGRVVAANYLSLRGRRRERELADTDDRETKV